MSDFLTRTAEFAAALLAGGTLEIVLLIVLVVVALGVSGGIAAYSSRSRHVTR